MNAEEILRGWAAVGLGAGLVVGTNPDLLEAHPVIAGILVVTVVLFFVSLPFLLIWRARQMVQGFSHGYRKGRTEGLTATQKAVYDRKVPLYVRHWGVTGTVCVIILAVMVPVMSPAVLALFLAKVFYQARTVKKELRGERPAFHTEGPEGRQPEDPAR
jgi:hypothetical protein